MKYGLFFIGDYNSLFNEINQVPVVYHLEKIHNFRISQDFLERTKTVVFDDVPVKVSSPEYVVFTKLLRAVEKSRFFGKDKLDIASLLLAYKYNKTEFDEDFFIYLINSSPQKSQIKNYFKQIPQIKNITKIEKSDLQKVVYEINYKL